MATKNLKMQRLPYTPKATNDIRFTLKGGRLKAVIRFGKLKYFDHENPDGNYIFMGSNLVETGDIDRVIEELQAIKKYHIQKYGKKERA